jgi:FkbM family methyltransferase
MNYSDKSISEKDLEMIEFVIRLNPLVSDVKSESDGTRTDVFIIPSVSVPEIKTHRFPNDLDFFYLSEGEPEFFYEDIFINKSYFDEIIELNEGDLIFDVGANVGYFPLAVAQKIKNFCAFSFEPAPPTFDALVMNSILHKWPVKLFNCGLSNREGEFDFTYYPNSSGYSTFLGNADQEKDLLKSIIIDSVASKERDGLLNHLDSICDYRFKTERHKCKLTTISEVIASNGVRRIDLLKIDAEKSEMDVYSGIGEENFAMIKQLVIEVHDFSSQAESMRIDLEKRGFLVSVKKSKTTVMTSIYAKRILSEHMELSDKFDVRSSTYQHSSRLTSLSEQVVNELRQALPARLFPESIKLVNYF